MALNSLLCADVPLRTYTLTHSHLISWTVDPYSVSQSSCVFLICCSWKSIGWMCTQLGHDHVHLAVENRWVWLTLQYVLNVNQSLICWGCFWSAVVGSRSEFIVYLPVSVHPCQHAWDCVRCCHWWHTAVDTDTKGASCAVTWHCCCCCCCSYFCISQTAYISESESETVATLLSAVDVLTLGTLQQV